MIRTIAIIISLVTALASQSILADTYPFPASPASVAKVFHKALINGHGEVVMSLLRQDVIIYDGEIAVTSAEAYAKKSLEKRMAWMAKADVDVVEHQIEERDRVAISTALSTMRYKKKAMTKMETLIMTKTPNGWKISHIHWSE